MSLLTSRQEEILASIIEQYAEVAVPVGSVTLAKLFKVSSATIRSEMAKLEQAGMIKQPHTSAGRIPTDKGYRMYVNEQTIRQEAKAASNDIVLTPGMKVMDKRINDSGEAEQTIRSAVKSLVDITHNVGLATIGDSLYVRGIGSLFSQPEFMQPETVQQVAKLIDNLEPWLREAAPNEPLNVYIGRENPVGKSSESSLIISRFRSPFSDRSYIGVLGPTRQDYRQSMRLVRHAGASLEEVFVK